MARKGQHCQPKKAEKRRSAHNWKLFKNGRVVGRERAQSVVKSRLRKKERKEGEQNCRDCAGAKREREREKEEGEKVPGFALPQV